MAHVDTTQYPLLSASHCIVLTNWSEIAPTRQTPPLGVSKSCHIAADQACDCRPSVCSWTHTVRCMSWNPRCQRILFIDPIAESLFQLTPQHRPPRGQSLHDRHLETSSAPTEHQASSSRHVRPSSTVIVHCRTSPGFS